MTDPTFIRSVPTNLPCKQEFIAWSGTRFYPIHSHLFKCKSVLSKWVAVFLLFSVVLVRRISKGIRMIQSFLWIVSCFYRHMEQHRTCSNSYSFDWCCSAERYSKGHLPGSDKQRHYFCLQFFFIANKRISRGLEVTEG